ncbi:hypothetical protein CROQUDRAFT_717054 [Cronartium quercuum f. sp. fusiforme G11]|uniref:Uncharacterized protein n=1 Tax=Cronartium quercuum f. sp. fusiforme G11 TaxID=708437 RepID=A0A9P6ND07_9BASI|nr:hypothetical protein CROQUDRAFT_717054 [Cronartium quercuum f. sp. fusiforme G11]
MSSTTSTTSPIIFQVPIPIQKKQQRSVDPITGGLRKLHIRRLFDLLNLSLLKNDLVKSRRIFKILIRCKEVQFIQLWQFGLRLLDIDHDNDHDQVLSYLKACRNLDSNQSVNVLIEYISTLISLNRYCDALNELELYLSTLPYSQNSTLHQYAGMLSLFLAQENTSIESDQSSSNLTQRLTKISNSSYFKKSKTYFDRSKLLDPNSLISNGYIALVSGLILYISQIHSCFSFFNLFDRFHQLSKKQMRSIK